MDKSISIIKQSDKRNSGYVPGSANDRVALVWPLTREAVILGKKYDVEQRLQRHITRVIKNKRATGRTKDLADAETLEEGVT